MCLPFTPSSRPLVAQKKKRNEKKNKKQEEEEQEEKEKLDIQVCRIIGYRARRFLALQHQNTAPPSPEYTFSNTDSRSKRAPQDRSNRPFQREKKTHLLCRAHHRDATKMAHQPASFTSKNKTVKEQTLLFCFPPGSRIHRRTSSSRQRFRVCLDIEC
ncbi:hypothetical protein CI102_14750 [Trichoderma harzianum]|uniref:Uncharacterized protein n=1 Tax=Trichoderma harzianum CBS 226.95 TaxID=983964 RepID=A0A2T4AR26_TRIHA|nr:hypothetical protein M431DRAFT_305463 [Trichoderma harzianum CBS 226.95]PKK40946.1 hypothetical protein CI102_14750 [Trichoderma harzianum]PTB59514.1 hypothetical protein M431DRAFT_305463 [Trichoderma harzianum CBS 226.95]